MLADKMQYVTKLLGHQNIAVDDLFRRVYAKLGHEDGWDVQEDYQWLDQCFQVCRDEFIKINAAIYDVLNATDSKQAIAVVKGLKTVRGSKLN